MDVFHGLVSNKKQVLRLPKKIVKRFAFKFCAPMQGHYDTDQGKKQNCYLASVAANYCTQ